MFSLLNVRSVEDLSTRARIRDAAVRRFAVDGFGVPVRVLAADAGVSAALVIHHFGSKDGLRRECDAHVLGTLRELQERSVVGAAPADMLAELAAVEEHAPVAGYVVQALLSGGDLAIAFLDTMAADAEVYLREAVEAGTIRPSRDPAARARFLVSVGLGALLVHLRWHPVVDGDLGAALRNYADLAALPGLELYTEGLLADHGALDAYLAGRTPGGSA